jgi:hypothetical protein
MGQMSLEAYEAYVKSGAGDRTMVTSDSDFQRLIAWGLAVTLRFIWRKTLHAIWRKPSLEAATQWLGEL